MGARQHNENRRISSGGRWMGRGRASDGMSPAVGLSQSVTVTRQNRVLLLQIETFLSTHPQQSRSVTARPTFDPYLLQIETNQTRLLENLNL